MATASEIKAGLDDIAQTIRTERQALKSAKARIGTAQGNLAAIPTVFADVIADAGTFPGGAEEVAALTPEFLALRDDAALAVADLGNRTEF